MPVIAIELTPKETAAVDRLAKESRRARKQQVTAMVLAELERITTEKASNKEEPKP